ncbi:4-hydroxythreonine-4-phosphate dehydrogenase PdxA (plasmid) [Agrobacterium leguminum]|uniref:4-hydroxythreonine-4-phosphate dehydrogenase PdxA n=1 Tax=Agrobacterium leguminum TaxID=2792015 RepID=UPI00272D63A9|nr:4-hydroxythreonine-4-phosphate dehydrogenase PdxA [Agrobacterium leguminum]WLE00765.1 4-hydroxythreonine-4-phosphate dehydrogenase PdxA [Agrobacterium leguminum]
MTKTAVAIVLGDPAGVGPELIAKLIAIPANQAKADILVIGEPSELEEGMRIAGVCFDYNIVLERPSSVDNGVTVWHEHSRRNKKFERAVATRDGGLYCLDALRRAIEITMSGVTQSVLFGPLNKSSLHLAGMRFADESQWFADLLGVTDCPHGELNYLEGLWTSRVTSHIALKDVSPQITRGRIVDSIRLVFEAALAAGIANPRIAVCGLNPHNGENGSFGREEIDTISPAIEEARTQGLPVVGPFPADTIFLRVREFDGIVTMYHDQGQIAIKLLGFSGGVTVHGGLPITISTPAHGTAFDIYGHGKADPRAMQAAFDVGLALAAKNARP